MGEGQGLNGDRCVGDLWVGTGGWGRVGGGPLGGGDRDFMTETGGTRTPTPALIDSWG